MDVKVAVRFWGIRFKFVVIASVINFIKEKFGVSYNNLTVT